MSPKYAAKLLFCIFAASLLLSAAHADVVKMKCGRKISGKLIEKDSTRVVLQTLGGKRTIPREKIRKYNEKKKSAFEKYEEKIEKYGDDAKGQIKLARMCLKGNGFALAREHMESALKMEPENKACAKLKKDIAKKEKKYLKGLPKAREVILKVGIKGPRPSKKEFKWLADKIKSSSRLLEKISDYEIFIKEVRFSVGKTTGDFVYERNFAGTPNGWTNIPMGKKNWWEPVIVHELGHSNLGLPDDDNAASGGTWGKGPYPCIMAHNWKEGFGKC